MDYLTNFYKNKFYHLKEQLNYFQKLLNENENVISFEQQNRLDKLKMFPDKFDNKPDDVQMMKDWDADVWSRYSDEDPDLVIKRLEKEKERRTAGQQKIIDSEISSLKRKKIKNSGADPYSITVPSEPTLKIKRKDSKEKNKNVVEFTANNFKNLLNEGAPWEDEMDDFLKIFDEAKDIARQSRITRDRSFLGSYAEREKNRQAAKEYGLAAGEKRNMYDNWRKEFLKTATQEQKNRLFQKEKETNKNYPSGFADPTAQRAYRADRVNDYNRSRQNFGSSNRTRARYGGYNTQRIQQNESMTYLQRLLSEEGDMYKDAHDAEMAEVRKVLKKFEDEQNEREQSLLLKKHERQRMLERETAEERIIRKAKEKQQDKEDSRPFDDAGIS